MKLLVGIFITLFIVFMSYVFIGGYIEKNNLESRTNSSQSQSRVNQSATKTFALSDVASHNTYNDCWLIISGKVYDVTDFLGQHPGGASEIIPHCGTESTQAFATQDRGAGGGHSVQASDMLANYLIGMIK